MVSKTLTEISGLTKAGLFPLAMTTLLMLSCAFADCDWNDDGLLNIIDVVGTVNCIIDNCWDGSQCDWNGDMQLDIIDVVSTVSCIIDDCWIVPPDILFNMPSENEPHEGTWLQWPHNHLYGPWYREDVEPTFIAMTGALHSAESVHIIAYDSTERSHIVSVLMNAGIPLDNIDFFIHPTDDVWSRDNGPIFVFGEDNTLNILDWGFNGWGFDTPFANDDVIPDFVSTATGIPRVDLSLMVLEGGAIEHDGHGTMLATRSSVTHPSRNPDLTESQIEDLLTSYLGITQFIWLDGVYGLDITDMHIDGFVKFANDSTLVTMDSTALNYWYVSNEDIEIIYSATDTSGEPYSIVTLPLTQNNVVTTFGNDLGYKGSYCNYYIANDVVLVPTYNDPNDEMALTIIQGLYPNRTVTGVDVRNLYEYGGMIHCVTQQQPALIGSQ